VLDRFESEGITFPPDFFSNRVLSTGGNGKTFRK
jgi:hypothetical protein